ncbi:UDP-N-acetylmuramate dehydrogenase [Terrimonas ferruginea]|uniref:UDP-N-acetylmuramate dehydrogenase n=1 Tax=Terrimonas ferruginea TaxID=249 RepID=UPI00041A6DB8|nr:UDP-N-acetylmuramate dehydrogenase [Terrimonas ferruginea]
MQVLENFPLKDLNTFGVAANARYYAAFDSIASLNDILSKYPGLPLLILGGGSNVLLTKDFDGLVLKNDIRGIRKVSEDAEFVYVKAGAGENWHQFVLYTIEHGWGGLENLSLIPGCVGASPMQNIGAYGVEIKDLFEQLTAFHLNERSNYTFRAQACEFGYRESVFKRKYKGQFVIADVTFKLRKQPVLNTSYGAIASELKARGIEHPTIRDVSDVVISIRQSKLPDPKETGNAGSFFKNPSITIPQFDELKKKYPDMVAYLNPDGTMKLAAGWLIEQAGWKGYREGDAGVHARQALVLVNHGHATGAEIVALSEKVISSIKEKFGVELEREVNIV